MTSSASLARIMHDQTPEDGSSNEDSMEDARSIAASHFSTLTSSATMPSLSTLKSSKSSTRQTILESSKESLLYEEAKGGWLLLIFLGQIYDAADARISGLSFFIEVA